MRICKHSCGIIRILISYVIFSTNYGYVLSDARFDWLVEIRARIKKNYFDQEVNKQHFPSFVELFSKNILKWQ